MPIIADLNQPAITKRLIEDTHSLFKNKSIPFPKIEESDCKIVAIFPIQQLKNYNKAEISTSVPEGYRVLISAADKIILALNFYTHRRRIYFSHAFDGDVLHDFIMAINELADRYASKKTNYSLCCIEFLHAEQPYLGVFTPSVLQLYTYTENSLTTISKAKLSLKLAKIQSKIQPIP